MKRKAGIEREAVSRFSEEIGARVRTFREMRGLRLVELGARARIAGSVLSRVESGKVKLSISSLYRIAEALGLAPATILDIGTAVQQRFEVFGEIGQPVPDADEPPGFVNLPLQGDFPGAVAFRYGDGYLLGKPLNAVAPIAQDGERFVIRRLNIGGAPSLHVGCYQRVSGLGRDIESTLLRTDSVVGHWLTAQEHGGEALLSVLDGPPPQARLLETPNLGWLSVEGIQGENALAALQQNMPFDSQSIAEHWLVIGELKSIVRPADGGAARPNRLLEGIGQCAP